MRKNNRELNRGEQGKFISYQGEELMMRPFQIKDVFNIEHVFFFEFVAVGQHAGKFIVCIHFFPSAVSGVTVRLDFVSLALMYVISTFCFAFIARSIMVNLSSNESVSEAFL